jgi:hypothetical protein
MPTTIKPRLAANNPSVVVDRNMLFTTEELFLGLQEHAPAPTFIKDTLFGTVETGLGQQCNIDFQRGSSRLAPFTSEFKRGIAIPRQRYKTSWVTFPDVKLTSDIRALDSRYRTPGENVRGGVDSRQRIADMQVYDLRELDLRISRTCEWMCNSLLFTGKIDILDGDDYNLLQTIDFGPINEVIVDSAEYWDAATPGVPYDHLSILKRHVTSSGYPANLFVFGVDAANAFLENQHVRDSSNFLNFREGTIDVQTYKTYEDFGVNVIGNYKSIQILSYEAMYESPLDGQMHYFLPPDYVLVASTAQQHRFCYGQITQVEEGNNVVDYHATRVPQYVTDAKTDQLLMRLWSRPLPVPVDVLSWSVAKVCNLVSTPLPPVPQP